MTLCVFHPEALREYGAASIYYTKISPELGDTFLKEMESCVQDISDSPKTWRIVEENIRVYWLHRFPFAVYYTIDGDSVIIAAIMHTSRKPGSWEDRI